MPRHLTAETLRDQACTPSYLWEYYLEWMQEAEAAQQLTTGSGLTEADRRALDLTLPRGLRYVVRMIEFDGDVLNGGIAQFFYNHTPLEVMDTLDVLRTTGLDESATVLEESIALCRTKYDWPAESDERWLDGPSGDEPEISLLDDRRCNEESSQRDFLRLDVYLRTRLGECIPKR